MQAVTTIRLDIAKSIFQVHGVDAEGNVVVRRKLKRRHIVAFFQKLPPCLVGIEACASSHHWARELQALGRPGWLCQGPADADTDRSAARGSRKGMPPSPAATGRADRPTDQVIMRSNWRLVASRHRLSKAGRLSRPLAPLIP